MSSTCLAPKVQRVWAMPNQWTFQIPPIKELVAKYVQDGKNWIDPFAGFNSPAEYTNDLNKDSPAKYHLEANDFIKTIPKKDYNGALIDPPYSLRQVKECYDNLGLKLPYELTIDTFGSLKNNIALMIKPGGYVICCGWNTNGMGLNRGFKLTEILLVPHGGFHNDTIVTVERKINQRLTDFGGLIK